MAAPGDMPHERFPLFRVRVPDGCLLVLDGNLAHAGDDGACCPRMLWGVASQQLPAVRAVQALGARVSSMFTHSR